MGAPCAISASIRGGFVPTTIVDIRTNLPAMTDRAIEWDKDDTDALRFMKKSTSSLSAC